MQNIFADFEKEIAKSRRIALVTHKRPDADAIGSTLAFGAYAAFLGKEVQMYCKDSAPAYLTFLPKVDSFKKEVDDFWRASDLIILIDCGDLSMPGIDLAHFENKRLAVIDHHASNALYGDINMVDKKASATSEILHHYFNAVGFDTGKDIATNLLCGVYTDTDAFTNLGTTPESLRVSSELLAKGANFKDITAYTLRNKSIASLKLWGRALERLRFDSKKGIATTVITQKDFSECNAVGDDAEGVANLLNHLSGVKMAMVLRELEHGQVKGSLRTTSELIDVSEVAKLMGGGGHKKAAGFTVQGRIEETDSGWQVV